MLVCTQRSGQLPFYRSRYHNFGLERSMFRSVKLLRDVPKSFQIVVGLVIERNGYWAHPEAWFCWLCWLNADGDEDVRHPAVARIVRCREQASDELRPYQLPAINFDAKHYLQLRLDAVSKLQLCLFSESIPTYLLIALQAVERAVQLVTQAASAVVGQSTQHGYICARLKHRTFKPEFESKRDFRV